MYRPYTNSLADFRPRDVESQLRDLTQDFATAFNTGNYDQAAGLFASDGVLMAPLYEGAYGQKPIERLVARDRRGGVQRSAVGDDPSGSFRRHGDGTGTILPGAAQGGRDAGSGAREVCESVAASGSLADHGDCWSRTSLAATDRAA